MSRWIVQDRDAEQEELPGGVGEQDARAADQDERPDEVGAAHQLTIRAEAKGSEDDARGRVH